MKFSSRWSTASCTRLPSSDSSGKLNAQPMMSRASFTMVTVAAKAHEAIMPVTVRLPCSCEVGTGRLRSTPGMSTPRTSSLPSSLVEYMKS